MKSILNITTGDTYRSAAECAREIGSTPGAVRIAAWRNAIRLKRDQSAELRATKGQHVVQMGVWKSVTT